MIYLYKTLLSTLSTILNINSSISISVGSDVIFEDKSKIKGTSISLTATSLSYASLNIKNYNKNVTQDYIESMNINELNEFINKLENIEFETPKKLIKK